jgi:diketogulonate reductase-like aldo/keto reductase
VVGWAHEHGMLVVAYSTLSGWPFLLRAVDDPHVRAIAAAKGVSAAVVLLVLRHAMQVANEVHPAHATQVVPRI